MSEYEMKKDYKRLLEEAKSLMAVYGITLSQALLLQNNLIRSIVASRPLKNAKSPRISYYPHTMPGDVDDIKF